MIRRGGEGKGEGQALPLMHPLLLSAPPLTYSVVLHARPMTGDGWVRFVHGRHGAGRVRCGVDFRTAAAAAN
eukprot:COSAG01_NODE_3154_length_6492_cov_9.789301_1_plen_72_part_00